MFSVLVMVSGQTVSEQTSQYDSNTKAKTSFDNGVSDPVFAVQSG